MATVRLSLLPKAPIVPSNTNFEIFPDISTVTLPVKSVARSKRLGLINVDIDFRVPNSVDPNQKDGWGAHGDDHVESLPQCAWSRDLVRIGTIGDGSCFFHAVLKAADGEYQKNNSYRFRTRKAYTLRRDLAYLLTLSNPNYPTEEHARKMLWHAFKLDSDESLVIYLTQTKMMSFPEPPRMPKGVKTSTSLEWTNYETQRREWEHRVYPQARQYAQNNDIVDCRQFLGDATMSLPLNSYYFTLREGYLVHLAIERKTLSMHEFPNFHQLITILINSSRYVGDTDVIGWFGEVLKVDIYFCEVYNDRVVPSRIINSEGSKAAILINNAGGGYRDQESAHFETMGLRVCEHIQTVFLHDDPILKAFQEDMHQASYSSRPKPLQIQGSSKEDFATSKLVTNISVPSLPTLGSLPVTDISMVSLPTLGSLPVIQSTPTRPPRITLPVSKTKREV